MIALGLEIAVTMLLSKCDKSAWEPGVKIAGKSQMKYQNL